jgi:hypothetical protein
MNEEFEELIASFRIVDDLERAVESTIQDRLGEFTGTPLTALPVDDGELVDPLASLRVKRVDSRVIPRLRAA